MENASQVTYSIRNRENGNLLASAVVLAGTSADRRKGLSRHDDLSEEAGLWICPCEAIHTFGMKFAIDAMFLDRQLRVRKVQAHVQPRRIAFCLRAESVIEFRAGTLSGKEIALGSTITFQKNAGGLSW